MILTTIFYYVFWPVFKLLDRFNLRHWKSGRIDP